MSDDEQSASTTFHRQRRDLFVVSGLLLLTEIAKIKAEKLSFLGFEATVQDSHIFLAGLWLLWAYWFLRYCYAYRDLRDRPVLAAYRAIVQGNLTQHLNTIVAKEAQNLIATDPQFQNAQATGSILLAEDYGKWSVRIAWAPTFRIAPDQLAQGPKRDLKIRGVRLIWLRTSAALKFCLFKFEFTEYVFPFIFGLFPLYYAAYQGIRHGLA